MRMCLSKKRTILFKTGEEGDSLNLNRSEVGGFAHLEEHKKNVYFWCVNLAPVFSVLQGCVCMFIMDGVMISLINIDLLEVRELNQPWLLTSGFDKDFLYLSTAILAALFNRPSNRMRNNVYSGNFVGNMWASLCWLYAGE